MKLCNRYTLFCISLTIIITHDIRAMSYPENLQPHPLLRVNLADIEQLQKEKDIGCWFIDKTAIIQEIAARRQVQQNQVTPRPSYVPRASCKPALTLNSYNQGAVLSSQTRPPIFIDWTQEKEIEQAKANQTRRSMFRREYKNKNLTLLPPQQPQPSSTYMHSPRPLSLEQKIKLDQQLIQLAFDHTQLAFEIVQYCKNQVKQAHDFALTSQDTQDAIGRIERAQHAYTVWTQKADIACSYLATLLNRGEQNHQTIIQLKNEYFSNPLQYNFKSIIEKAHRFEAEEKHYTSPAPASSSIQPLPLLFLQRTLTIPQRPVPNFPTTATDAFHDVSFHSPIAKPLASLSELKTRKRRMTTQQRSAPNLQTTEKNLAYSLLDLSSRLPAPETAPESNRPKSKKRRLPQNTQNQPIPKTRQAEQTEKDIIDAVTAAEIAGRLGDQDMQTAFNVAANRYKQTIRKLQQPTRLKQLPTQNPQP